MPALVAEFQKQILKNQFKKAYSVYAQNLQKTRMVDFDGEAGCYYGTPGNFADCAEFYDKFAKNMHVIKTCKGSALAGGCIPEYTHTVNSGCIGYSPAYLNNSTVYVLNDGSIMIPYYNTYLHALFLFDINGMKGPNMVGYDIFSIAIRQQTTGAVTFETGITRCLDPTSDAPFKNFDDIYN